MNYPYILSDKHITIIIDGKPKVILKEDENFGRVLQAIKDQDEVALKRLIDKKTAITEMTNGKVAVEDNKVIYEGEECHGVIVERILTFVTEGLDATPLLNFLEKLMGNPSRSCVEQLYEFLEHKSLPIDPDGDFYAYKAVRSDWLDKHTGTIKNEIGDVVEIKRNKVDDNPRNDCSYGLHVGSIEYVREFGSGNDKYVIVKVNPADAVAVPSYDTRKMRCCKYTVVEEFSDILPDTTYRAESLVEEDEDIPSEDCESCGDCDGLSNGFVASTPPLDSYRRVTWNGFSFCETDVCEMDREKIKKCLTENKIEYDVKSNTEALRKKIIKSLS